MRKFYSIVVRKRKTVICFFLILSIISFFMKSMVSVDYDINDYLPDDSPSTIAIDILGQEFEGGIPNARVMVSNVTIPQALDYKEKLEAIDGVSAVTWLDDSVDIIAPLDNLDPKVVETYYKDNTALFTVTIEEDKRIEAVAGIEDLVGEDNAIAGSAVATADATTNTVSEIQTITVIAVLFVLIVLLATTNYWL